MDLAILIFFSSGLFLGFSLGANDSANVFGTAVASRMIRFTTAAVLASIFILLGAVFSGAGAAHGLGELGAVNALRRSELDNLLLRRELKDAGAVALKEIFDFGAANALMRSELDNSLVASAQGHGRRGAQRVLRLRRGEYAAAFLVGQRPLAACGLSPRNQTPRCF